MGPCSGRPNAMFSVVNSVGFIIDDRTDRLKIFELVSVNNPGQWCGPAPHRGC
jgi:hypothetical protein